MDQQFTLIIERDPESRMYVGDVVELSGCYTQAEDLESLERNAREAIGAYLATAGDQELDAPELIGTWRFRIASRAG